MCICTGIHIAHTDGVTCICVCVQSYTFTHRWRHLGVNVQSYTLHTGDIRITHYTSGVTRVCTLVHIYTGGATCVHTPLLTMLDVGVTSQPRDMPWQQLMKGNTIPDFFALESIMGLIVNMR